MFYTIPGSEMSAEHGNHTELADLFPVGVEKRRTLPVEAVVGGPAHGEAQQAAGGRLLLRVQLRVQGSHNPNPLYRAPAALV